MGYMPPNRIDYSPPPGGYSQFSQPFTGFAGFIGHNPQFSPQPNQVAFNTQPAWSLNRDQYGMPEYTTQFGSPLEQRQYDALRQAGWNNQMTAQADRARVRAGQTSAPTPPPMVMDNPSVAVAGLGPGAGQSLWGTPAGRTQQPPRRQRNITGPSMYGGQGQMVDTYRPQVAQYIPPQNRGRVNSSFVGIGPGGRK